MAVEGQTSIEQGEYFIEFSRIYDTPQALVFSMFTDPEHVKMWWGPKIWPVKKCTIDFQVGGSMHYAMVGPDGQEAWGKAVYIEIDKPNKIVFRDVFSDESGTENPELPAAISTVTFDAVDGKTLLTMRGEYRSATDRETVVKMGMIEGLRDTWDQLEQRLADLK